ncbi:MAG: immunoglobulin domain-containing protein [Verrucomicrobia bacterium]|nr:immunoglobulin domain-containing protein [Verrucomicrobiota bacterium]
MKFPSFLQRRLHWINLPTLTLLTLLQRSPVVRVIVDAGEFVFSSPLGNVLKSTLATAVTLGALNSRAGATEVTSSPSSPVSATVGTPLTVAFGTLGTQSPPDSWSTGGNVPPGLSFSGQSGQNLLLSGTPTTPGTFTMQITGDTVSYGSTPTLSFVVNVAASGATAPAITTQPQSQSVATGANVTFTAAASGSPAPTYQWKKDGTNVSGATSATLTLNNVQTGDAGSYTVVATNSAGSATSSAAMLTVSATPAAPAITTQPQSQTVVAGVNVTLTAAASGVPAPTLQWQKGGVNISGATGATLTLNNVVAGDSGSYTLVATNTSGTATSTAAVLTVNAVPPTISAQPAGHTMAVGATAVLEVQATGNSLTYQWKKDGTGLIGATSARLVIANAQAGDAGSYTVTVSGSGGGTVTSSAAVLSVITPTNPGRLINLSVRGFVGTGNQVLIMGFVTGGGGTSGTTSLLARAGGPSIVQYGVTDAIADPTLGLVLQSTGASVASNDNWGGTTALKNAFAATGASPFISDTSKDSALLGDFPGNVYSVVVSNTTGATGSVVAELYDVGASSPYNAATPRLVNLSSRGYIGANGSLIPGFVIQGQTAKTVLIRAIGPNPSFAAALGSGNLSDPILYLYHAHDGVTDTIYVNDNWGGDAQITAIGNQVGASALTSSTSKDAAILITLDPGIYSAGDFGVGGSTGITLVEVYDVP